MIAERGVELHLIVQQLFVNVLKLRFEVFGFLTAVHVIAHQQSKLEGKDLPVLDHQICQLLLLVCACACIADNHETY
jgi:hypothetical protein